MNKVKMFFIAAALVLTTAGVFAGKAKFVNPTLYGWTSTTGYETIGTSSATTFPGLTTSGTNQATITSQATATPYSLYTSVNGITYTAVYTSF